jgi:putative tricarboxylic transport membrane protein
MGRVEESRSRRQDGKTASRQDDPITHHPVPNRPDTSEIILALAVVIFGLGVIWQTTQIRLTPAYSMVGPRVIPYIVGVGLILTGLWLGFEAITGRAASVSMESEDVDPTLPTDWRTVGFLTVALLVYLVLLEPAGFVIASALLFFGAAYAMGSRSYARDLVVGIVMAAVLYVGFTRGLGLHLPAGVLKGIL